MSEETKEETKEDYSLYQLLSTIIVIALVVTLIVLYRAPVTTLYLEVDEELSTMLNDSKEAIGILNKYDKNRVSINFFDWRFDSWNEIWNEETKKSECYFEDESYLIWFTDQWCAIKSSYTTSRDMKYFNFNINNVRDLKHKNIEKLLLKKESGEWKVYADANRIYENHPLAYVLKLNAVIELIDKKQKTVEGWNKSYE